MSLAALETLAVIAYKQPVTVPEIQEIRGVHAPASSKRCSTKSSSPPPAEKKFWDGPSSIGPRREFLIHFGLKDLSELPSMEEFDELIKNQAAAEEEIPEEVYSQILRDLNEAAGAADAARGLSQEG